MHSEKINELFLLQYVISFAYNVNNKSFQQDFEDFMNTGLSPEDFQRSSEANWYTFKPFSGHCPRRLRVIQSDFDLS